MEGRRRLLQRAGGALASPPLVPHRSARADDRAGNAVPVRRRRPGDPGWPSAAKWEELNRLVGGRLAAPRSPFAAACRHAPDDAACRDPPRKARNPFFLGEEPALTQTSGWADAWTSAPSAYAVAGLVQSGGFGSFSKAYGLAAAGLLEAEVVTADGAVRVANACTHPDLFWALKGGGGGTFGVVTRLTLRTHALPDAFGGVFGAIRAASDAAYERLVARFVAFYAERLLDPHWGETATFRPDNTLAVAMVFQGLDQDAAERLWRPFFDWVAQAPQDFAVAAPFRVLALPARRLWDAEWLRRNAPPGLVAGDDRPGAPDANWFWANDAGQVGQFLHGYDSVWLPASLLQPGRQGRLRDALLAAGRRWPVSLHFNKGLAGAPPEAVEAARDTAVHPSAADAFALAIGAAQGPPAFPGLPGPGPDLPLARDRAARVAAAIAELRRWRRARAPTPRKATTSPPAGRTPIGARTTRASST